MPSTSRKQHNLMAMVAHNPEKAKEKGISQGVAKEFVSADKTKFNKGGSVTSSAEQAFENNLAEAVVYPGPEQALKKGGGVGWKRWGSR